jgi:Zn-dependent metalloprotease
MAGMKKNILIALTVLLTFACSCPKVLADAGSPSDKNESFSTAALEPKPLLGKDALERVIKILKTKVDIPAEYKSFTSNVYDNGSKTLFRLQWSSDISSSAVSAGSIEAAVDEDGNITSYDNYRNNSRDVDYKRRLPTLTKDQAFDQSRKFISNMCPDLVGQLAFEKGNKNCTIQFDGSYSFIFDRQHKNIPYSENNVAVQVNGQTGEIMHFNRNWNDNLKFPEPNDAMNLKSAQSTYMQRIPLELKYRLTKEDGEIAAHLEYSPPLDDISSGIDAITGEKTVINNRDNLYYRMASREEIIRRNGAETGLPATELNELKRLENFISVESADKLARGMMELGIDTSFRLNSYSYLKNRRGQYELRLEFMRTLYQEDLEPNILDEKRKTKIASGMNQGYANISFDARNSELLAFNTNQNFSHPEIKGSMDRAEMEKIAAAFLQKYKNEKYPFLKYSNLSRQSNDYMMKYGIPDSSSSNSFIYLRKINEIPFEDNKVALNIDPSSGKVTFYEEMWSDMPLPSVDNLIQADKAYELLLTNNPLELKYTQHDDRTDKNLYAYGTPDAGKIKLVYAPDGGKPLCIDAQKGVLLNYSNGAVYQEPGIPQYNDINNHPAQLIIQALADIGLLSAETNFRPEDAILQKEFLVMISKLKNNYASDSTSSISGQQALDSMYRVLLNEGVINEDEKAPDKVLTRENAVKYILRAAGYKKFAEMKGIFKCDYSDIDEIDPRKIGYAAIAKQLQLVEGTAFKPTQKLSRAEAVIMIYNYVKN